VPQPEVVSYEYESLLYCHPLSAQPVAYRQEGLGAEVATQTPGGFFVGGRRRDVFHTSGFRVLPMHENVSFPLPKAHLNAHLRGDFYHQGVAKYGV
jgi:hypothetical protein